MAIKTIIGRVGRDPEMSETGTGKKLARFSVAESGWDPEAKEETTTWYDISAFEKDAEIAEANINKGMRIYVTGRHSVYKGDKGDRDQITVNELGAVDRFRPESSEW